MSDTYRLDSELGRGHFGTVYRAKHADLPREFAIKLIPKSAISDRADLLEEAIRHASLPEHDNVVKVHDAGDWDDSRIYIASELCSGGNLETLCGSAPMDPATACDLISNLCRGIHHVHHHKLLHLDIRPANVLLSDGIPKLTDFGLARWVDDPTVEDWYAPHAAPELYESSEGIAATDVYATAMTLGHLLTCGKICHPFLRGPDLVQASADGDWPRLDTLGCNIPDKLRKVIRDATVYDPDKRTRTIEGFKRAVDRATPTVSFQCDGDDRLVASDGTWSIEWFDSAGRHRIDVKKGNRRKNDLGASGLTAAQAQRYVSKLITDFAYKSHR